MHHSLPAVLPASVRSAIVMAALMLGATTAAPVTAQMPQGLSIVVPSPTHAPIASPLERVMHFAGCLVRSWQDDTDTRPHPLPEPCQR